MGYFSHLMPYNLVSTSALPSFRILTTRMLLSTLVPFPTISSLHSSALRSRMFLMIHLSVHCFLKRLSEKERERREGKREIFHLLIHSLHSSAARSRPKSSQEQGTVSSIPTGAAGARALGPFCLFPGSTAESWIRSTRAGT